MSQKSLSRRSFLINSMFYTGGVFLVSNTISCANDKIISETPKGYSLGNFAHGVASFDPTHNQVIIWTRYTTDKPSVKILWQVSYEQNFGTVLRSGEVTTDNKRDYTLAVELQDLEPNKKLFYQFFNEEDKNISVVGETITLPVVANAIKLAVCSCSNYPAGLFNVYNAMAKSEADIIIHLGDYIYEYAVNQYGTNKFTNALARKHQPENEILNLADYRARYKQYRSDKNLQLAHQKKPFICVWDDHEISNDTYKDGAENHQASEGVFSSRKADAIKAYSEYLPLRSSDVNLIYRNFKIGNLVHLIMLDTRVIERDKQLEYNDYISQTGFNATGFQKDWLNPSRSLLGATQRNWLMSQVTNSDAKWQVLGQQVLMGKMYIPAELLFSLSAVVGGVSGALEQFTATITALVTIKLRNANNDPTLTATELARINTVLPYNLDSWDGYPVEREMLFASFIKSGKKIICLAGDTHNAWYNNLVDNQSKEIGKEFATPSVTSPGLEYYLNIEDTATISAFEYAMEALVNDLVYLNASDRGYLMLNFTPTEVESKWNFVNTIFSDDYTESTDKVELFS